MVFVSSLRSDLPSVRLAGERCGGRVWVPDTRRSALEDEDEEDECSRGVRNKLHTASTVNASSFSFPPSPFFSCFSWSCASPVGWGAGKGSGGSCGFISPLGVDVAFDV